MKKNLIIFAALAFSALACNAQQSVGTLVDYHFGGPWNESAWISAKDAQECNVSTAFSRAVCEGLGWDLINDRSTSLKADADRDRSVSLSELYSYVLRRAGFYLSGSSEAVQTASLYPEACPFVIASRGSREE